MDVSCFAIIKVSCNRPGSRPLKAWNIIESRLHNSKRNLTETVRRIISIISVELKHHSFSVKLTDNVFDLFPLYSGILLSKTGYWHRMSSDGLLSTLLYQYQCCSKPYTQFFILIAKILYTFVILRGKEPLYLSRLSLMLMESCHPN